jgi:hypothetical protein
MQEGQGRLRKHHVPQLCGSVEAVIRDGGRAFVVLKPQATTMPFRRRECRWMGRTFSFGGMIGS